MRWESSEAWEDSNTRNKRTLYDWNQNETVNRLVHELSIPVPDNSKVAVSLGSNRSGVHFHWLDGTTAWSAPVKASRFAPKDFEFFVKKGKPRK